METWGSTPWPNTDNFPGENNWPGYTDGGNMNPVINDLLLEPKGPYTPGQTFTVTVVASDPDARLITMTVRVSDQAGGFDERTVDIEVTDPLTYTVTGDGLDVTQDAANPAMFHVTVL